MARSGATSSTSRKQEPASLRKYQKIAQECYQLALVVKDQRDRRALLDLASKWLEMAGDDPKTLKLIAQVERLKGPAH
jgi:hypothetical protein